MKTKETKLVEEAFAPAFVYDEIKSATVLRGYVDHNTRISQMIKAGINLENWRQGKYDFPEGTSEDVLTGFDPTRRKGYDIADASEDMRRLQPRLDELHHKVRNPQKIIEAENRSKVSPEPSEDTKKSSPVSTGD